MRKADKYIVQHVLSAIGMVLLMLMGLQTFMLFVAELGAIGQGHYTVGKAFIYVLMQTPYHVYLFFPIACLIGVLMGLGMMANYRELLILRASGRSVASIAWLLARVIFVLVLLVCTISELVLPTLIHFSEDWKTNQRTGGQTIRTPQGIWLRQGNHFFHIQKVPSVNEIEGLHQYQFDDAHHLVRSRYIQKAVYKDNLWQLTGVDESILPKMNRTADKPTDKVVTQYTESLTEKLPLSPNLLVGSAQDPNELDLLQLTKLILAKRAAHLDPAQYEVNFWRRVLQPVSTFVMVLIAFPFIFGSTRSRSVGQRFMIGVSVGFLFHVLNELAVPISQIYQIQPLMASTLPIVFFAIIGMGALRITR